MMHPKIDFPGSLKPILDDLARPLHDVCLRDPQRTLHQGEEASLENGFRLETDVFNKEPYLKGLLEDFRQFMTVVMQIPETADGYRIQCSKKRPENAPENADEAHSIKISETECVIEAEDLTALRRALFRLENEMRLRRAPMLPLGDNDFWTTLRTRIVRSPVAPYRWWSGWELEDENDYYPDAYLNRLAHAGVNGIWVAGLFRNLVASQTIPELGPPQHRLQKLKDIVERAARYGIRVYFFCMEPRALPGDHPAARAHPEILGAPMVTKRCMCASQPKVLAYVREATAALLTEVPELAGLINIFCGERPTTCWWDDQRVEGCPICRTKPKAEMLGQTLNAFVDGIRDAGSEAELLAWAYLVDRNREAAPTKPMQQIMDNSSPNVVWMGNFEHGVTKEISGRKIDIHEYALSCTGPSPFFSEMAEYAVANGRKIYAKLQTGTSYELSSVPYVPVPGIVHDKIAAAMKLGVTGSMLTWIPGGFPSPMLKAVGESAFAPQASEEEFLRRLAEIEWGEKRAETVMKAWGIFSEAWQLYPFDLGVLYWGPITRSPAYHLRLEHEPRVAHPYNWGYTRKREVQPYEDHIERWVGAFAPNDIIAAFREMARRWSEAVEMLRCALDEDGEPEPEPEPELERQIAVAEAVGRQFRSTANVYEFYALRNRLYDVRAEDRTAILEKMEAAAEDDIRLAEAMKNCMKVEPALGFQSEIYDFSYSKRLLNEKILQVQEMLPVLRQWKKSGINTKILQRTVEEAETLRPDRDPDRWGD